MYPSYLEMEGNISHKNRPILQGDKVAELLWYGHLYYGSYHQVRRKRHPLGTNSFIIKMDFKNTVEICEWEWWNQLDW